LLLLGGGTGLAVNRHNEKVLADSQAKIVKADKKANLEKHLKADKEAKIKADKEADKQAKLKAESEAKAKAEADKQAQQVTS
jgi:colicin import membrane protein